MKYKLFGIKHGNKTLIGTYQTIEDANGARQRFPYFDFYLLNTIDESGNKLEKSEVPTTSY